VGLSRRVAVTVAVLLFGGTVAAAGCGPSGPPLPRAAHFRGPNCQSVAEPVVQVARAVRSLDKNPEDSAGAIRAVTDAQARLHDLAPSASAGLPEVGQLVTSIGLFRLQVDTHSADDQVLGDLAASNDAVVRRCTT
jgi:hypothetical protein